MGPITETHIQREHFKRKQIRQAAAAASEQASLLAVRPGYKGDPREILHFATAVALAAAVAVVARDWGRGPYVAAATFVQTAREEFTDRYRRRRSRMR